MDEDEYTPVEDEAPATAEPGSALSRLRALREDFTNAATVDLDVPGYKGELVARYHPLPWEVIRQLAIRGEKGKRDPNNGPMIACDGLANAIEGFFIRAADGSLAPLTYNGDPVLTFNAALMAVLGVEGTQTARERVRAVFPDSFSLVAHYGSLMQFQETRTTDEGEDEDLLAEAGEDETIGPLPGS